MPDELAVQPAVGMDLMTEEQETTAPAAPTFPATFEIEHEREPVESSRDVRMQAADGLSGVFEMPPSPAAQENAAPEFDVLSQPAAAEQSADDVREEAAAAAEVEPRPEFIVDRLSISVPLGHAEDGATSQMPTDRADPGREPFILKDAAPLEPTSAESEKLQTSGYTGICEFEGPRGSLEAPLVETRLGDTRVSTADPGKQISSRPHSFSPEAHATSTVAVETAEAQPGESIPHVAVWVAEEVALEPGEADISLEDEMRAALASVTTSTGHIEVPLGAAGEQIAAFTTEGRTTAEPEALRVQRSADEREHFEAMSDEIVYEAEISQPWSSAPVSSATMPEPSAMDSVASLQHAVPEFSTEATVAPVFEIPGQAFQAVPADDFGPAMGTVIDADTCERPAPDTGQAMQYGETVLSVGASAARLAEQHPLGAMAQAIADSPALSSVKREDAQPMVEAIVTRILEQIKPELIAHVLRELEKK
ncbi:MAG: hypothetical protein JOY79_10115 [Acidobacteriaceae bacterium]|nr:hypothetical protein [Acidobacteriaceae bacterium]